MTPDRAAPPRLPIRIMTRLLAELQTSIISNAVALAGHDLDRFTIFTLIVRQSLSPGAAGDHAPISAHSLAISLSKPYETVRRHVAALIGSGLCERREGGVVAVDRPGGPLRAALIHTHDSFVRFVGDLARLGMDLPRARDGVAYRFEAGVEAAADTMLAVVDTNRARHAEWADLVLFSTVLCANTGAMARDPELAWRYADETTAMPEELWRPARASAVARTLHMSETTVRRRFDRMVADGRLERRRGGVIAGEAWLNRPESVATSTASLHTIRRILERLAARGFPFDDPAGAYLAGRPADVAVR